jgi:nucleoside-diphosphate-sugar epimerase
MQNQEQESLANADVKNPQTFRNFSVLPVGDVLVTGSAGFLGSHLVEHFLQRGHRVIGVDNFSTGSNRNVEYFKEALRSGKYTFIEADVSKPWGFAKMLDRSRRFSHVFHMASPASPPLYQAMSHETMWVNSVGLMNAIEFADANGARVVFASTSEIYGDPHFSPQVESYWGNVNSFGLRSCYDEAKRFGEALIYSHNLRYKTKHGLVRIFNTYGPRMSPHDGRVIINFLVQGLAGKDLTVYGDGKQTRSFCFVSDLIGAITTYAGKDITEPVNIGNDREFTILELVDVVKQLFNDKKLNVVFENTPVDDPKQRRPDLTRAKLWLAPWQPQVRLEEGLVKMRDWLAGERL